MLDKNQDYLNYIRDAVPLSDVCAKLNLHTKRYGKQMRALCPFHNDRTPSLQIYQDHYHCYACRAHGDLFSLVQKVKDISFREAIAWTEEQFPFVLGQKPIRRQGRHPSRTPEQVARDYYASEHSDIPRKAANERGYASDFLERAEVYGTDGNVLCSRATREELDGLLQAHLIQRNFQVNPDSDSPYQDYFFKERLLFTLRDMNQRVVGFAGRSLSQNDTPKYLYTKGLQKDKLLYRMNAVAARWGQREEDADVYCLYLVEGLFDALRLESLGMDAVAILGSRLTDGQLRILEQFVGQQRKWDRTIEIRCFLDSDKAGVEGAYQLLRSVWRSDALRDTPLSIILVKEAILKKEDTEKDPDEFLSKCNEKQALAWLDEHRFHPMEFLLRRFIDRDSLAFHDAPLDKQWEELAFLQKVRLLNQIANLFSDEVWKELLELYSDIAGLQDKCFALLLLDQHLRNRTQPSASGEVRGAQEVYGFPYPLALEMARTGYRQEPMALDDASWDRLSAGIELVGRYFDELLPNLRQIPPTQPLLAFYAPKDVEQDRLKALPDHEELLLQHYLLNELLQEEVFAGYARTIPAVRYDPILGGAYTTGLGYTETFRNTDYKAVSFAYQVDMPVLRGERRPTDGLFRHYYDCWKDFIYFLQDGIERLEEDRIYRVKLDIRGYYDNIRKYFVRDVLIGPLTEAFGYSQNAFRRLVREDSSDEDKQKQAEKVIDILLERLFGWEYLDPQTGECKQTVDPLLGIPQGPALSAYVANILLFPLDKKVSQYVNQMNGNCKDGEIRVRYARYVDDMVILSSDPTALADIEEMIHTHLRSIELELSPKTDHSDAVEKDEARLWLVDERGGLGVSALQLIPEDTLDNLWSDGYEPYVVDRHDALNILKSAADILAAPDRFDEAFIACFRTENVRYRDASRLAAFILEHLLNAETRYGSLYGAFSAEWQRGRHLMGTLRSILSRKDIEPLVFFEGLLILLRRSVPLTLPAEEQMSRQYIRQEVARQIVEGTSIRQAKQAYGNTEGKNTAFLSVKMLQLKVLAYVSLSRIQDKEGQEERCWSYIRQKEFGRGIERHLQRWEYMSMESQTSSDWVKKPPIFDDIPKDDEFQLFHYLTSCLSCCTKIEWFQDLGSLFLNHSRLGVNASAKIREIERIWFLKEEDKNISSDDARIALQTLSNFLQQSYLPEIVSQNPAMRDALFSETNEINYLPVPPVPSQDAFYPGIFAVSADAVYLAKFLGNKGENHVESVQLPELLWSKLTNSVSEHWETYHVKLEGGRWEPLDSALKAPMDQWTSHLVEKIANLYEKLCVFFKKSRFSPILSKYHLFLDAKYDLQALTYYHSNWTEPAGIALAGSGSFLKWVPLDKGPGKAERAAALLLEDLLNLWKYPVEGNSAGNLLKVLSYGLGRLTGRRMRAYLSDLKIKSFESTVQRTLDTWRLFAKASPEQETLVLLEVALTDRLMEARLNWQHTNFFSGEDSAFLEQWLVATLQAEMPRLGEILLQFPTVPSLEIPMRRGVAAWRDIGFRLLQISGDSYDTIHALGASALLRAVSLDIRMQVLECVRAMNDEEMQRLRSCPLPLLLLQEQTENAALVFVSESSQQEQADQLIIWMEKYQNGYGNYQLEKITPAGWYLLLAWVLELDGQEAVSQRLHPEQWKNCEEEIRSIWEEAGTLLFPNRSASEDSPFPYSGLGHLLETGANTDQILKRLHRLDEMLNFEIRRKCADTLSFGRGSSLQTQRSIQLEPSIRLTVPTQFVSILHDGSKMLEYEGTNGERVWTQTMLSDQILSVSAVARKAAELAWEGSQPDGTTELHDPQETGDTVEAISEPRIVEPQMPGKERLEASTDLLLNALEEKNVQDDLFRKELRKFQKEQHHSWTSRKNLNGNIDRIAFFQIDVDDSYVHPLAEVCIKQEKGMVKFKKDPPRWNHKRAGQHQYRLYSCSEYRRRKLLEAAFSACEQFDVDILLLPEYSVRMETVQWMLETIKSSRYHFSVWAGTCRLIPGRKYESELLKELNPESEDYKAILPIICTQPVLTLDGSQKRKYPYLYLKRSKKYPSISMEELINPSTKRLDPVMKDPGHMGGLMYGDARDDVMELICAEVFLATNPGNITAFAQVYDMLNMRFSGVQMGVEKQREIVRADLQTIGERTALVQMKASYLTGNSSIENGLGKYGRTPILLVPAYTTRTVDYYVTGQAGYLATGLTTVFCNAVGLKSRGESCFVGTDSWEKNDGEKSPFMPDYTPYHGALPGIYRQYDAKAGHGALGKEEQALVICDINPLAASGSRPRPESMLQPLSLVAHLPIIESVTYRSATKMKDGERCGPYDQCRCTRCEVRDTSQKSTDKVVSALYQIFKLVDEFSSQTEKRRTTAYNSNPDRLANALETLGIELKSNGLKERADCYRRFHQSNLQNFPPPTLLDWIWVEIDFPSPKSQGKTDFLNVPEFKGTKLSIPNL